MSKFYIYIHLKPNGDPFYVGKGCDGRVRRSHDFKHSRNQHHKNIVKKYGIDEIGILVFYRDSESEAFIDEIKWISVLREYGYALTNLTNGGDGSSGRVMSEATRAKLSAFHSGKKWNLGKKHSDESKAKMSLAKIGIKRSSDSIAKQSISQIGREFSKETRNKISSFHKEKPKSISHRAKLSTAMRGKPWSEARRAACLVKN